MDKIYSTTSQAFSLGVVSFNAAAFLVIARYTLRTILPSVLRKFFRVGGVDEERTVDDISSVAVLALLPIKHGSLSSHRHG